MKLLSSWSIRFYQKFISPHKGYCCAYGVLHRGDSCSEVIRKRILEDGLFRTVPKIKEQFKKCRSALEELEEWKERKKKNESSQADDYSDIGDDDNSCTINNRCGTRRNQGKICDGCGVFDVCDFTDGCDLFDVCDFTNGCDLFDGCDIPFDCGSCD